ncbi:putative NAD dependent epimerase/dehydratase [Melia azedarach]|uniref:NAD dependent epimerase/dehydratase n=1 Tax=Melia azedarach TaxID=155640 RepID=A0ACC1WSQ1_MELAZ|nr:putative NAD dependent epimerase/dehydratase [Melia azedarach]
MEIGQLSGRCAAVAFQFSQVPRAQTSTILRCSTPTVTIGLSQPGKLEWQSRNRMFILGMGFVGRIFAEELKNEGWIVCGTCTNVVKLKQLKEKGYGVYLFNANEAEMMILNTLKDYTHLLVSIPPVLGIGDLMLQHGKLLRSTLRDGHLQWLGYLSSTGVYGHCDGAWVDEGYPANPMNEMAKLRLAAEEGWLNLGHDLGLSTQVFRLGGIYGPGRSAVDTIIKQVPQSEGQKMRRSRQYTSRIHVDDICQVLKASINKPSSWNMYNVVDDDPAPREEVFVYARDLVEKKWPGRLGQSRSLDKTDALPEQENSRGEKRVSNARIKKELGVRLRHPSYKSGLQSIIDQMDSDINIVS